MREAETEARFFASASRPIYIEAEAEAKVRLAANFCLCVMKQTCLIFGCLA
jgi:hypothetical protein